MKHFMSSSSIASAALVLSLVALGMSIFVNPTAPRRLEPESLSPRPHSKLVEDKLGELEVAMAELRDQIALLDSVPATRVPVDDTDQVTDTLLERLEELESSIERLVRAEEAERLSRESSNREVARSLDEWMRTAMDPSSTTDQKLQALRRLRGRTSPDGADARLPVLPAMIELVQTSDDPDARADVWRQLSHCTDVSLLVPLLDSLTSDPSARVREEAAETLADFLPNPGVEAALRFAAENDASDRVRQQSLASLDG